MKISQTVMVVFSVLFLLMLISACSGTATSPQSLSISLPSTTPPYTSKTVEDVLINMTGLELPPSLIMTPGSTITLPVQGLTQNKADISGNVNLILKSSQPEVITIEQGGKIKAATTSVTGQNSRITVSYGVLSAETTVTVKTSLQDTVVFNNKGIPVVNNPADLAVVVNKKRTLADNYIPIDLVEPNVTFTFKEKIEKRMMRNVAAKALEKLFAQASKDNIKLVGISAYRSYATQKSVFAGNAIAQGEAEAAKVSAQPGQSEHQTGLAIDVSSESANYELEEFFGTTPEGKWLDKHAADFGFIIRYPKGKETITGYNYEPWHIRYVGINIAKYVMEHGITLEEYFQDAVPVMNN